MYDEIDSSLLNRLHSSALQPPLSFEILTRDVFILADEFVYLVLDGEK